jgi:ABC-2 type transport system ATP-binding protein
MRQRLGIAAALLGDPPVLLFDEPMNGLDLDGVRWVRRLVRGLADEGRTVLVSSHLMSEMQQTADHLVVLGRGRLLADASIEQVLRGEGRQQVRVRTPAGATLAAVLSAAGLVVLPVDDRELLVEGAGVERVGEMAHQHGLVLHLLAEVSGSLEQAYLELTGTSVEHVGKDLTPQGVA